jgi:SAM-dependent methyltransferase
MHRSLDQINSNYQKSKVYQWGSEWRGSLASWHTFCINTIIQAISEQYFLQNKPLSILEIGCGLEILTEKVAAAIRTTYSVKDYLAVDVSSNSIDKAKQIFPDTAVYYQSISEDLHELQNQKFDLILGFQFLFYLTRAERQNLFQIIYNLESNHGLVILSSNIRFDTEDPDYINEPDTHIDLTNHFTITEEVDVFTALYVEQWEGKLLKTKRLPFIRYLLSKEYFPKKAHEYFTKKATSTNPNRRTRIYIMK